MFVGSLGGQGIVKFALGSEVATGFVPAGSVQSIAGLLAEDTAGLLYACESDSRETPAKVAVRTFELGTGTPKANYPMPDARICNDLAFDNQGNLFATDSAGVIYKLAKGEAAFRPWLRDPTLAPVPADGFGADGIVFDGESSFYVTNFQHDRLLRIPVQADGTAGPVATITVTPGLNGPDALRLVGPNTLLVVEKAGRLTKLVVNDDQATGTTLVNRLDTPTSVAVAGTHYWISEGQLDHFLGTRAGTPFLPFLVRRFATAP